MAVFAVMVATTIFTFVENIVTVANITVFTIVITFVLVNLSLIWLRYKEPNIERPFKVPLNIGKFPILPFLGLVISVAMVTQFNVYVISIGLAVIGTGALFYVAYNKTKNYKNTKSSESQ